MAATVAIPGGLTAYSKLHDALAEVGIPLSLDLTPDPPIGEHRGWHGHAAAAVSFHDPGSTRLVYAGTSINEAARLAMFAGARDARDYGIRAALAAVSAQLQLDDWFRQQDQA